MAYQNSHHKFVAVLNGAHALPVRMNALAHAAYGLSELMAGQGRVLKYGNSTLGFEARISEFPFIILQTHNSGQLVQLLNKAKTAEGVRYNLFSTSMLGPSAEAQIAATAQASAATLDLVLVLLFGERERVEPLTRKYSLLKA